MDPVLNFAKVTVSTGYDASATTIVLLSGHGAKLPAPATDGAFNLVWWNSTSYPDPADDPNVEIVRVTARTADTLTVIRAQENTVASTKNTADKVYKMILAFTKKSYDDSGYSGTASLYVKAFTNADLAAGILTVTHNLGQQYVIVQVTDDNDQDIQPKSITLANINALSIDLTTFGTISGTWHALVGCGTGLPPTYTRSFVNADLSTGVLTVTHNLGSKFALVTVYDNTDAIVQPDSIVGTDANTTTISLVNFGAITGTWNVRIVL